jgi:F-type H+-transporting ATPase subunit gamma
MSKGNLLSIKNRIKAVNSILSLSKSMEMISLHKFKKFKKLYDLSTEKKAELYKFMSNISIENDGNSVAILFGSDRSLCGSFNSSMYKFYMNNIRNETVIVGSELKKIFNKNGNSFIDYDLNSIVDKIIKKEISKIDIYYTKYNKGKTEAIVETVFPWKYEPNNISLDYNPYENILYILSIYLENIISCISNISNLSENYSRMVVMKGARKSCDDLILDLNRSYNKGRQSLITQEISEIIGGRIE